MDILQRVTTPTPPFFRKLRNISLILASISASIVTLPVDLPAMLVKIAGYIGVAGAVAGAVSQAVVTDTPPAAES